MYLIDAQDIICRRKGEGFSTDNEIDVWHGWKTVTIDDIFTLHAMLRINKLYL